MTSGLVATARISPSVALSWLMERISFIRRSVFFCAFCRMVLKCVSMMRFFDSRSFKSR